MSDKLLLVCVVGIFCAIMVPFAYILFRAWVDIFKGTDTSILTNFPTKVRKGIGFVPDEIEAIKEKEMDCPFCFSKIKDGAKVCRFCNGEL